MQNLKKHPVKPITFGNPPPSLLMASLCPQITQKRWTRCAGSNSKTLLARIGMSAQLPLGGLSLGLARKHRYEVQNNWISYVIQVWHACANHDPRVAERSAITQCMVTSVLFSVFSFPHTVIIMHMPSYLVLHLHWYKFSHYQIVCTLKYPIWFLAFFISWLKYITRPCVINFGTCSYRYHVFRGVSHQIVCQHNL